MSEQPNVLRLASMLESCSLHVGDIEQYHAGIALRRLHSVNAELLEAIETQAARMAYAGGMGASEWESFLWPEAVVARARALGQ